VQYAVPRRGLPGAASLRRWGLAVAASRVILRIVGAAEGRRLNRRYRQRNTATNVLSFATGDVVLCHPVIRREAKQQRKSLRAHYAHLVVHGVLHLRGHDHRKKRDAVRMERREIRLLARFGFADPYKVK
jgi:probable rRNA maturation factor